jgi:hypothetical protein
MSIDARLKHGAVEAHRSVAGVTPPDIEAAARALRIRRTLAGAVAAAAVVALIAAATMSSLRTGGESDVVDQPSTSIPDAGPAAPPILAGEAFDAGWTVLPRDDHGAPWNPGRLENGAWVGFDGTEVVWFYGDDGWTARPVPELEGRDVIGAGNHYVRAGLLWAWVSPGEGEQPAEVWNTPDGTNWRRVEWDGPPPEDPFWRMTRSGDTILVDSRRGHFYRSGDGGRSFASVPPPDAGLIWFVWAHNGGFRAIPNSAPPELWHSPDGASWSSLGPVSGLDWIEPGYTPFPQQLSTDPSSGTILVGDLWRVSGCWGDVYRSTDGGLSWHPLEVVESLFGLPAESRSESTCWSSAPGDLEWMLVMVDAGTRGASGVWGSRNGTDWYHFGADSYLQIFYNTYPVVDEGVMIPPAP